MNGFKVEHKDESGQGVIEVQGMHEVVDGFSGMRGDNKPLPDSPAWFPKSEKKRVQLERARYFQYMESKREE